MTILELLFLLLVAAGVGAAGAAVAAMVRGQYRRAGRVLAHTAICATLYCGVVILVAAFSGRRVYHVGDAQCFDDWCITVIDAKRSAGNTTVAYDVTVRISSRARRVSQRERGAVVYLTDARNRRFDPDPPHTAPLDAELQPGESIVTLRTFHLPADAIDVALVFGHQGFPINVFIIGENHWFHHPPVVRLE